MPFKHSIPVVKFSTYEIRTRGGWVTSKAIVTFELSPDLRETATMDDPTSEYIEQIDTMSGD